MKIGNSFAVKFLDKVKKFCLPDKKNIEEHLNNKDRVDISHIPAAQLSIPEINLKKDNPFLTGGKELDEKEPEKTYGFKDSTGNFKIQSFSKTGPLAIFPEDNKSKKEITSPVDIKVWNNRIGDFEKTISNKSKEETLKFVQELTEANKKSHSPELLRETQKFLSSCRTHLDTSIPEEKAFSQEDALFLEHGKGDPVKFFTDKFPVLDDCFNKRFPTEGNNTEFIHGARELTAGNQVEDMMKTLNSEINLKGIEDVPGIRTKAVLRAVVSLFYSGMIPALDLDEGKKELINNLDKNGFPLNISPKFLDNKRGFSKNILENTMKKLNFTDKEIHLGKGLLEEIPLTGNDTLVPSILLKNSRYIDYKNYDIKASQQAKDRSKKLGIDPSLLIKTGYIFHSVLERINPYELRKFKHEDRGWQPKISPAELGMVEFNDLMTKPVQALTDNEKMVTQLSDSAKEIDKLSEELKEIKEDVKVSNLRPLFKDGKINPDGIMLVHAAKGFPEDGVLYPNSHFGGGHPLSRTPRNIIEFSWNGVIDQWNKESVVILTPLSKAPKEKIANLWYTATSHLGPFTIPEGSTIVLRDGFKVSDRVRKDMKQKGIDIIGFPENGTAEDGVEKAMLKKGYTPMLLGTDLCGGVGTETTLFSEDTGLDLFIENSADEMTTKSEELAKTLGIPSAKGTENYPIGYLTFNMEGYKKDLNETGWIKKSYHDLPEFKKELDEFTKQIDLAEKTITRAQKKSKEWKGVKQFADSFKEMMWIDYRLEEAWKNNFYRTLDRELSDMENGAVDTSKNPGQALTVFVDYMNQIYKTDYKPEQIRTRQDFISMRQDLLSNNFSVEY